MDLALLCSCTHPIIPAMFVVTEADAAAIREVFERDGELSAAIKVRRRFLASVVQGSAVDAQRPQPSLGSDDADIVRASERQHAIENINRHVDFSHPTFVYT